MNTESDTTITHSGILEGTSEMLKACVEAVLEGQPRCMVIGRHQESLRSMVVEFVKMLDDRKEKSAALEILPNGRCVHYDDSTIIFVTVEQYFNHNGAGCPGYGEFWDSAAEDKALEMALNSF